MLDKLEKRLQEKKHSSLFFKIVSIEEKQFIDLDLSASTIKLYIA
jgi:hypothetical protein